MQFALLIYDDGVVWAGLSEEEQNAILGEYFAYTEELRKSGAHRGGEALQPTTTAKSVRVRDGEQLVTDGPFAETKEALGGYYVLDCDSFDEAVALAAKIPAAGRGAVEVRPAHVEEEGP
jgi:hypothetical protein